MADDHASQNPKKAPETKGIKHTPEKRPPKVHPADTKGGGIGDAPSPVGENDLA